MEENILKIVTCFILSEIDVILWSVSRWIKAQKQFQKKKRDLHTQKKFLLKCVEQQKRSTFSQNLTFLAILYTLPVRLRTHTMDAGAFVLRVPKYLNMLTICCESAIFFCTDSFLSVGKIDPSLRKTTNPVRSQDEASEIQYLFKTIILFMWG